MSSTSSFQVEQLRTRNIVATLEAIGVFLLSLFLTAFGPSLLLRYVYGDQQLLEPPMLLEMLPVVSFVLGAGYFLYTMFTNITRERKARKLEKEVLTLGLDCGCGGHHSHDFMTDDFSSMDSAGSDFSTALKKSSAKSRKVSKK